MRARGLEILRGALDGGGDFGRRRNAAARLHHQADPQALERRRLDDPVELLGFEARIVAHIGQRQGRHHQRGVVDVARHRPGDAADVRRIDRDPPAARLQTENAAPARRQAHRAADVGAEVQRAVARRRRRARARRRAAGIAVELPRIARQRVEARQARRQHAVVGHGRLGEQDRARLAQARRRRRVRLCGVRSSAAVPSGFGSPRVAILSLTVAGTPSSGPIGSPSPSALRTRAPPSARAQEHKDRSRGCAARRPRRARSPTSSPRPATIRASIEAQQLQRRHTKWLRARRFGGPRVLGHCQDIAERSLTKIGAFFHRPFSFASATVTFGNWNRKALTLSSASFFCASPIAAL